MKTPRPHKAGAPTSGGCPEYPPFGDIKVDITDWNFGEADLIRDVGINSRIEFFDSKHAIVYKEIGTATYAVSATYFKVDGLRAKLNKNIDRFFTNSGY